ncbi:vacuolar transporter chaperone [Coemansia sp. IMI 209127]|nr:vacuolar transporter chaperone [Coemansia sp. IMI 209127]
MKGNELDHNIRACEHYIHIMTSLEGGERIVGLGQTEDAVGAAMGQIIALARFRRSNFTALWRQLDRLQVHCPWHYGELLDHVALSPLFTESTLESQQLFRASQVYSAIQAAYTASSPQAEQQQQQPTLNAFPDLRVWRGWIDHACVGKVHNLLSSRLSADCSSACAKSPSTAVGSGEFFRMNPGKGTPPSPHIVHKASSSSASSSLSSTASSSNTIRTKSKRVFTVYLDNAETLQKYHSGLTTEASSRELVSLSWLADDGNQNVYINNSTFTGPWFAAGCSSSAVMLKSDQVLPFLHGELNLNKLGSPVVPPPQLLSPDTQQCQAMHGEAHSSSPENGDEYRARRRDQLRKAQKIQKKIILESLDPLILVAEERIVYTDPDDPESISVVLRRNATFRYKDNMSHTDVPGESSWLADVIDGNPPADASDEESIGDLPFDTIEIHLGNKAMPSWLSQLFFDTTVVRPVLDFDVYIHGIATLRTRSVNDLPYWLVDYSRGSLGNPSDHSMIDMSATLSPEQQPALICPCESTHLLHSQSSPGQRERTVSFNSYTDSSNCARSYISIALLIAVILSAAFTIWPHQNRVIKILFELSDLVAQWIARLLDLH